MWKPDFAFLLTPRFICGIAPLGLGPREPRAASSGGGGGARRGRRQPPKISQDPGDN